MKQARHVLYWTVVAIAIIPTLILVVAVKLYDFTEMFFENFRPWCYREQYATRSRRQ